MPPWCIAAIALALCSATPVASSQTVDTSQWTCEFCPFESGHRADYDVGAGNVDDDSAYFDDASGLGDKGVYAIVDGEGAYTSSNHRLQWTVEDLGLDSRYAKLEGARPGTFDYHLTYRELPRREFITTQSIFLESGESSLALPSGWVRSGTTAGFSALGASLASRDIESDRSVFGLGGRYRLADRISFSADYRRQDHDGVGILGGSYFTTSSLLPMPFDYVTDEVDLGIRYALEDGFLSLAWYLSDFENDSGAFGWESPFATAAGAEFAELAQPPDNSFQQLTLSGGYRFDAYRTYLSFSASLGEIEQDEPLLAYTTNANLTTTPPPRSNLDGEIDTTRFAVTVTTRPVNRARINFSYRYDERDNKTPQEVWTRVITDTFVSGDDEPNIPYSYERSSLSLSGDYDLFDSIRVSAGYEHRETDRDFQEVADQDEDSGWGRVRWRPNQIVDVDIKGGASKRDPDRFDESLAVAMGQNPLLRKYNLAYRYREFGELTLTAALPETPLSVTIRGMLADDSYSESELGLVSGDEKALTADLSWAVSDTASVYLNGGVESIESVQLGSESFAQADWRAMNEDEFVTVGAGFRVREIADSIDLSLDYVRSDGNTEIDVPSAGGGQSRFPDLESTLDDLRFRVTYRRSERLEFAASARYQRFETEDWALEGVDPATIPVVLTLGADPYDDDVVIFGLTVRYSPGADSDN